MSEHEISERLLQSKSDIAANRICSLRDLDEKKYQRCNEQSKPAVRFCRLL